MVNCIRCGGENRPAARFCRFCGQELASAPDEIPGDETIETGLVEPPVASTTPELPVESPEPTTSEAESEPLQDIGDVELEAALPVGEPEPGDATEPGLSSPPEDNSVAPVLLPEGTLLAGRYRVLGLTSQAEDGLVYTVEDLAGCWSCGSEQEGADQRFCSTCGAELSAYPHLELRALPEGQADSAEVIAFNDAGVAYQILAPVPQLPTAAALIYLTAGYRSDPGRERLENEDSLLALQMTAVCETRSAPILGLFAVADGIGGSEAGEAASRAAVHCLAGEIMKSIFTPWVTQSPLEPDECARHLCDSVLAANQVILDLRSRANRATNMGCTLTAALVWGQKAALVNVGDSRSYRMRGATLTQVTRDHSVVARLVEQGVISPEEIYTHNQKSVIYRSLGDRAALEVDSFLLDLEPGDRLLLCSDGLWEMVRDGIIEEVLLERYDPQQACDRLIEMANLGGGEDNISVVIVRIDTPS